MSLCHTAKTLRIDIKVLYIWYLEMFLIPLICINKYELFEKDDDLRKMWVKFPYFPYFLIRYQMIGFSDFLTRLGRFLGLK